VALEDGQVEYEKTDRGWISYFNDLHKGRNTGTAWSWFIDVFTVACLVFCITGLFLLQMHAGKRPATWPLVALGLVAPCCWRWSSSLNSSFPLARQALRLAASHPVFFSEVP
jgi:hypothetical protein